MTLAPTVAIQNVTIQNAKMSKMAHIKGELAAKQKRFFKQMKKPDSLAAASG